MGILLALSTLAQTNIKDGQEVFGTWTKSKSPYIIEGEAIVPVGKTLTIKPGVVVQFKTGDVKDFLENGKRNPNFTCGFLIVNGKIVAKGKKNSHIKFTRFGSQGTWGNVSIYSQNPDNLIEYCWFEYSYFVRSVVPDENATGAVTFNKATGTVRNCYFINNGWTALNCKNGANPLFTNNIVVGNQYALESNSNSKPVVTNTIFWDNKNLFFINGGATINISFSLYPKLDSYPIDLKNDGNNIIGVDPQFVDIKQLNFDLQKSSPAIKKGKGGKNIGVK